MFLNMVKTYPFNLTLYIILFLKSLKKNNLYNYIEWRVKKYYMEFMLLLV